MNGSTVSISNFEGIAYQCAPISNGNAAELEKSPRKKNRNFDKLVAQFLGAKYSKRPEVCFPDACDGYVAPTLLECAHLVFEAGPNKLFLGPQKAASQQTLDILSSFDITGIVNCTKIFPCHHRPTIKYCQVPVDDIDGANIAHYFEGATSFINSIFEHRKSVLVHCQFGVSRSATIVLAYLMRFHSMSRDEAYIAVKRKRPKIQPNEGFWKQLKQYEEYLQTQGDNRDLEKKNDGMPLDTAKLLERYNIAYSTCKELPDLLSEQLAEQEFWRWVREGRVDETLFACLDFIWGRGLISADLEWFNHVCQKIEEREGDNISLPVADQAIAMVEDQNSEFCSFWAGEIHKHQIEKLRRSLASNDDSV